VTVECVADHAVPSYAPTLAALVRSRARGRERTGSVASQLVVAMPTTPDRPALPGVTRELTVLAGYFPPPDAGLQLTAAEATRAAVREQLARHAWAHFACHAEQDLMRPGDGSLLLTDGPLRLLELAELQLPALELAYLSACETAVGGAQLPDEAIHLAAAMHLIGYRHVVATMWNINDGSAPDVAAEVYAGLFAPDGPDADLAARALHRAVGTLRDRFPTEPLRWAPYVHIGP
jgi:CHAT domain-containing protein